MLNRIWAAFFGIGLLVAAWRSLVAGDHATWAAMVAASFEMAKTGFACEDAIVFWDRTNREDWEISEQSYLGISSRGYVPGPFSEREQQLWEFDQFVLGRLGGVRHRDTETQR